MSWVATAVVGSAVIGGAVQSRAAKKATAAQERGAKAGIEEQRLARESFEERTEPFRQIGVQAGEQLQGFIADPSQQLAEINPIVDFLRQQGFEQIQESAAAQGRLGAGGTLQDLTRFDVGLTSTVIPQLQNQRFNQLFNTAQLGANVAAGQGGAALQTGANISNLLGNVGQAQAQGAIGQSQAITGGLSSIAGAVGAFPNIFGGQPPPVVSDISIAAQPRTGLGPAPVADISVFG